MVRGIAGKVTYNAANIIAADHSEWASPGAARKQGRRRRIAACIRSKGSAGDSQAVRLVGEAGSRGVGARATWRRPVRAEPGVEPPRDPSSQALHGGLDETVGQPAARQQSRDEHRDARSNELGRWIAVVADRRGAGWATASGTTGEATGPVCASAEKTTRGRDAADAHLRCGGAGSYRSRAGRGVLVRGSRLPGARRRFRRLGQGAGTARRNRDHDRAAAQRDATRGLPAAPPRPARRPTRPSRRRKRTAWCRWAPAASTGTAIPATRTSSCWPTPRATASASSTSATNTTRPYSPASRPRAGDRSSAGPGGTSAAACFPRTARRRPG